MSLLLLCYLLISFVSSKHIDFNDCGNNEIKYIDIDPCNSSPCDIIIGNDYNLSVQFTANEDSSTVQLIATAKLPDGESIPLPAIDLCASQVELCPIRDGSTVTAKTTFNVPSFVQPMSDIKVEAQLIGDGYIVLGCADFSVNLVA